MPSSISTVGQLVSVIRAQLAARTDLHPVGKRTSSHDASCSHSSASGSLDALIRLRVKSIRPDDPNRGRKAFRIFLESILLAHFGEHLINDPKFYQLVDDVHNAMEAAPEVRKLIAAAVDELLIFA